ncbi:MAG TPA: hypothetical protein VE544_09195 [Nitrososphaeraceae archaeon]|jgi:hypothetical protein|nr:hypothetical protein [Nitrososphaeraceae archaeon]
MILGLVLMGFDQVTDVTSPVYAQTSSSCDRFVVSPSDCSPPNSFSPLPDDSSAANEDDNKDRNSRENDDADNSESRNEDKKSGDIESEIPSTVGSGVPFP